MRLYSAVNHRPISTFFFSDNENYYQTPTTLGSGEQQPLEWMLLSYAIQLSQPINLELYKLKDGYSSNPVEFLSDDNPEALEEFLDGDPIGYLAGIRMTDNVAEDPSQGEGCVKYVDIPGDAFCERLVEHINTATELTVMKEIIAYGFDGEPLIVQRPAAARRMPAAPSVEPDTPNEEPAPIEDTPAAEVGSVSVEPTEDTLTEIEAANTDSEVIADEAGLDESTEVAEHVILSDVGLNRSGEITTFHIKTAKQLERIAPSLGIKY